MNNNIGLHLILMHVFNVICQIYCECILDHTECLSRYFGQKRQHFSWFQQREIGWEGSFFAVLYFPVIWNYQGWVGLTGNKEILASLLRFYSASPEQIPSELPLNQRASKFN